jgi:aryl-alcohol dehydrogenase-like predicted oxidoreductase
MRNIGRSGLQVSPVGVGCNNFGARIDFMETQRVVHTALDLGLTLFDTADIYGNRGHSEEFLGRILDDRRKDIVLATKFGMAMDEAEKLKGGSRRYIVTAIESSLRRLKTDWIDLYQFHIPDLSTPIEETLRALDDLVRAGKVRYFGCSKFRGWQIVEANWTAAHTGINRFISCQEEYSLLARDAEQELIPAMEACGLGFLPYFPLASGLLTGKYKQGASLPAGSRFTKMPDQASKYLTQSNWAIVSELTQFCAERDHTLLDLAFSWLLSKPVVSSVIAGATTPEQIEQNVRAAEWVLSREDQNEIDRITRARGAVP